MSLFESADSYYVQEIPSSIKGYRRHKRSVSYGEYFPEVSRSQNRIPLCIVHDDQRRYRALPWIEATIYKSDDTYIARNETLRLYGDGASEHKAIEDLSRQIVHFYEFYRTLEPDEATQDALEFKQLYQDLLIELS